MNGFGPQILSESGVWWDGKSGGSWNREAKYGKFGRNILEILWKNCYTEANRVWAALAASV